MDETIPQNNEHEKTASGEGITKAEEQNYAVKGKVTSASGYILDLALIIGFTLLTIAFIYVPVLNESVVRPILGFAMALFLPGYAVIAALFPRKKDISGLERIVLSFALSIAVVPLIGYGLNFTSWGIRLDPIVVSLSIFTVLCTLIAYWRRHKLDEAERFYVDFLGAYQGLKEAARADKSPLDRALNVVLIVAVVLSVCAIGYMVFSPKQGEKYTEFYILGPNSTASEYPQTFTMGEQKPIIVNVANHEGGDVTYELVIALKDNITVSQLSSESLTVGDNQTWNKMIELKPDRSGTNMEIEFSLYQQDNMTAPYRECWLWINVTTPLVVPTNQTE